MNIWNCFFQNIDTILLAATLIILIFYTIFTYDLRNAAIKQTELSLRPFVVIEEFSDRLVYKNIGHSHALDVETNPFNANGYFLKFAKWSLIEDGTQRDLKPRGEGRTPLAEGFIRAVHAPNFTPKALAERDSDLELILKINYTNLEEVVYFTKVKINKKRIKILSTGKCRK